MKTLIMVAVIVAANIIAGIVAIIWAKRNNMLIDEDTEVMDAKPDAKKS